LIFGFFLSRKTDPPAARYGKRSTHETNTLKSTLKLAEVRALG
jgi:hypothetical protein